MFPPKGHVFRTAPGRTIPPVKTEKGKMTHSLWLVASVSWVAFAIAFNRFVRLCVLLPFISSNPPRDADECDVI